jgi:hypothetical protein
VLNRPVEPSRRRHDEHGYSPLLIAGAAGAGWRSPGPRKGFESFCGPTWPPIQKEKTHGSHEGAGDLRRG